MALSNFKMSLRMLWRLFSRERGRAAVAFTSFTVGATVVASLFGLYFDISIKMREELKVQGPNFFIGPKRGSDLKDMDERQLAAGIAALPAERVEAVLPYLYGVLPLGKGKGLVVGVDFPQLKKLEATWAVKGQWISVDFDHRHAMIGTRVAKRMGLDIGSVLAFQSPVDGTEKMVTIKGIIETGEAVDDQVFVSLDLAQELLGKTGRVSHVMLRIAGDGQEADRIASTLESRFPDWSAHALRQVARSEGEVLQKITGLVALVIAVIMLLTLLGVMTTLVAMAIERRQEIALMKALGAGNRSIWGQFIAELVGIAVFGVSAGILLGQAVAQILGQTIFSSAISFRVGVIPFTLAVMGVTAGIAAIFPMRMIARMNAAAILKGE